MLFRETPRSSYMLGNRGVSKLYTVFICGIAAAALGILYWYASQLVLAMIPDNGTPKQCFAVQPGSTWQMEFKHSYELTLWQDYFTVNGENDMTLTHTIYQSLGCGFPFSAAEGKFERLPDGHFKLTLNRPYKIINMRPAVQANPKILYDGTVYDLCKLFGHGTMLTIKVEPRYRYWLE